MCLCRKILPWGRALDFLNKCHVGLPREGGRCWCMELTGAILPHKFAPLVICEHQETLGGEYSTYITSCLSRKVRICLTKTEDGW